MSEAPRVLIVEDEPTIRHLLRDALRREGFRVAEAGGVAAALAAASEQAPALVVLDLGLPDGDGLRFIDEYRVWSAQPVLVLSARQQEQDKVLALDRGADDFLSKPFSVAELLARVRALLRRHGRSTDQVEVRFEFSGVTVDLAQRRVQRDGSDVHLSPKEFRLLAALLTHAGKVLTWRQLLNEVWGPGHAADTHYLRIYVGHLRQKLEPNPALPMHLLTEVGVGYRFVL